MAYNVFTSHGQIRFTSLKARSNSSSGGFALVAVLLLAVLLTLVVVALFSLLNVETQSGGNVALRNQARQNALTGLDLAIGELQKQMGPDQRISATAAFLDSNAATEVADGVEQPHWTGVWDSYKWSTTAASAGTVPTYSKTSGFRGWLVSVPKGGSINPANSDLPKAPGMTSTNSVTLVGKGTVLPKGSETNVEVKVWKVDADVDQAGNRGRYAWWVGDEGVKAKVNYPSPTAVVSGSTPTPKQGIDLQRLLNAAPRNALEAAAAYETLKPENPLDYTKALTFSSLPLVFKSGAVAGDFTKAFHDYTIYSRGVLSDVQNGGLKKDLNLLLELPKANLPSYVWTATNGFQKVYSYTSSTAGVGTMGPDWGYIYRYYNLYKSPYLSYANGQYTFYIDKYNSEVATNSATSSNPTKDGSRDFILPQTLRVQYLFGFFKAPIKPYEKQYFINSGGWVPDPAKPIPSGDVLYIAAYPTMHLWNPYNIQIRTSTQSERDASPPSVGGTLAAQIWSFPSPPLSLSFDGGGTWRPFIAPNGDAKDSIFQSYGGSMCTNWIMSGNFFQLVMDPGGVRLLGINDFSDQQMYWQDQINIAGKTIASPKRAFDLIEKWTSSNMPPHSDFLGNSGEHHVTAPGGNVDFKVKWNVDTNPLSKNALGRALFYEGDQFNRMPGVMELNTANMKTATAPDIATTYKTLASPGDIPGVSPSSNPKAPNMAFSFNINTKAFPKDYLRKSKANLFSDPLEKNYLILGADAAAAQMAPIEITVQPIQGSASSTISNYPTGTKAVQVDSSEQRGYFGDQSDGITSHVVVEFPTQPMSSLTQLQHVALGRDYTHPMYQVGKFFSGVDDSAAKWNTLGATFFRALGNSYAHPAMLPEKITGTGIMVRSFDHSFYANNTFWDSYFLSGITPEESVAFTAAGSTRSVTKVLQDFVSTDPLVHKSLPSSRLVPFIPATKVSADLISDLIASGTPPTIKNEAYARSASWLMVDGAFNINSTSIDAWTSILAANQSQQVPYLETTTTGNVNQSTGAMKVVNSANTDTPVLRTSQPNNSAAVAGTPQTYWNGYRKLSLTQIRTLAEKIVEQIKKRGPFLSLAEFVNRQVSTNADLNGSGALQTAIDASGLNSDLTTQQIIASDVAAGLINKAAAQGDMAAGAANYITQADLLKPIAGSIAARSDTFTIRAYGEVSSRAGKVVSRAWCEAVVQRTPDYMDQTDPVLSQPDAVAGANPGNATPYSALTNGSVNQVLGRRFKIIQFRWLNSDEV